MPASPSTTDATGAMPASPPSFEQAIASSLAELDRRDRRRTLRVVETDGPYADVDGRRLLNLASNDYLGLSGHPAVKAAAVGATERYGVGAGASRLVSGHTPLHAAVEARFAAFKHGDEHHAALLLPTGYMANLATLTALARPGDTVLLDKLCHASLIDAARASGATVRVFPHLGYDRLERLLERWARRPRTGEPGDTTSAADHRSPTDAPRAFVVTDSVFSMDGDVADLPRLCDLCDRFGATLIVDEAHGTGVLGEHGRGLCERQGVSDRVGVIISTASKALGGLGGIVTASPIVIEAVVNRARPFIFSTGATPMQAAAIDAAIDVIRDEPWRRERVVTLAERVRQLLAARGWPMPPTRVVTPIVPLICGEEAAALSLARRLEGSRCFAVAIRPPAVAAGTSRVRLSLRADLTDNDIDQLSETLKRIEPPTPGPEQPPCV